MHTHQRAREEPNRTRSSADLRRTRPTRTRGSFRLRRNPLDPNPRFPQLGAKPVRSVGTVCFTDCHDHDCLVVAKRRPSCCRREATTATVSSPRSGVATMNYRSFYRRCEATTATFSSPRSGVRHDHHHLAVAKRRLSCRREATIATVSSPRSGDRHRDRDDHRDHDRNQLFASFDAAQVPKVCLYARLCCGLHGSAAQLGGSARRRGGSRINCAATRHSAARRLGGSAA